MARSKSTIATPAPAFQEMAESWDLIDDLIGGTQEMRERASKWLPAEERESPQAYRARLGRSILYGALRDTIRRLRSKPFSKPVALEGTIDERISAMVEDVDGQGSDLTQFAAAMFDDAVAHGKTHLLVSYPAVAAPNEDAAATAMRLPAGQESALGIRPHFVHVKARDLIHWTPKKTPGGATTLAEVRIKECEYVEVEGELQEVEQIRVIRPGDWELWQKPSGKDWAQVASGTSTLGDIGIVTVYFHRTGFMVSESPLQELAWCNLAHYQSDSDQRNILRFARFGTLFVSGLTTEEAENGFTLGPARMVVSTNADADMKCVEHSGAAINAGRQDLQDLEARMEVLGLQPLMSRTGDSTATGQAIDESKTQCDVQAWVRALERGLHQAFGLAAKWLRIELADDFKVNVFSEFGLTVRASEDIRNLIASRQAGLISHRTFLLEVKRRALLSETLDPDEELEQIREEGPSIDGMTGLNDPTPPQPPPAQPRGSTSSNAPDPAEQEAAQETENAA